MKKIVYILSVALAAAACTKEENHGTEPVEPGDGKVVFSAAFGDVPEVKTQLSGTKVLWEENDPIKILWDGGSATAKADKAGATANFSAKVEQASAYYAVYPSLAAVSLTSGSLVVDIPSQQHGTFADANIAVAKTTGTSLAFKNLCALGKFTLSRNDIARVEFRGHQDAVLAGTATLSIDGSGVPGVEETASPQDCIVITPASGDAFAAGNYYFSVIPGDLDGISFILTTTGGKKILDKVSDKTVQMVRSGARSFGTLDDNGITPLKARFAEGISGAEEAVSFSEGDVLSVVWNGDTAAASVSEEDEGIYTLDDGDVAAADEYYAVYPASAAKDLYGDAVMIGIPTSQSGAFKDACIWMAGTDAETGLFNLRNITAVGKITLGRSDIKKITVGGNKGEGLAGTVYVSLDQEGMPSCEDPDADEITLEPSGDAFAPGTYYFALAPGTYSDGLSFTLETAGGNVMFGKAYPEKTAFERAAVLDFGTIDDMSAADALRLRFIFGPEAGTKAIWDPNGNWPDASGDNEDKNYPYTLEGQEYNFYVKDLSSDKKWCWRTNNKTYADCIGLQTATIYFGLPAIENYKLTKAVVGQCRRGSSDGSTDVTTQIGVTGSIPASVDDTKTYVTGGELQEWHGFKGDGAGRRVVDHVFTLSGTEPGTVYYLNSDTQAIGLYFARIVLSYETQDSHFKGFPEEWAQEEGGQTPASVYDDADIRILFIGNSFTRDAVYHLPGIIKAAGIDKKILLTHMYYGGRTAQRFYKNWNSDTDYTCYQALPGADGWVTSKAGSACTLAQMAAITDWDVITIQEHTGNQTSWYWTDEEKTALQGLINYALNAKSGNTPKVCYVMSQAYLNLAKAGSNQCFSSEEEMYSVITTQARKVMEETDFDGIISTGTMLQNLRTSSLNDELHLTRDGFHMNLGVSRYGASCAVFESVITPLTGKNLDGNTYRYVYEGTDNPETIDVTDVTAPIALAAARAAIQSPFAVTNMNNQ